MNANNNSIKVKFNVDNELFLSLYRIADYFRLFSWSSVNRQNKFREIFIQNLYFRFRFGNVSSIYVEQIYNGR